MPNSKNLAPVLIAACICLFGSGCDPTTEPHADHDTESHPPGTHVHADGTVHTNHSDDGGHSHDNPPHGGTILDWGGGKYHLEFLVNHREKKATVYILGSNAKDDFAIEAESIQVALNDPAVEFTLNATPQDSDSAGKSSRFVGHDDALENDQDLSGTIFGTIGDTPYSGEFKE